MKSRWNGGKMAYFFDFIRLYRLRYLASICMILGVVFFFGFDQLHFLLFEMEIYDSTSFVHIYRMIIQMQGFFLPLLFVLAGIPATSSFADEWEMGSINYQMIRIGKEEYLEKKVQVCFLSAFSVIFLGMSLFTLLLWAITAHLGIVLIREGHTAYLADHPLIFLLVSNLLLALGGAMWNMVALVVSSFWSNQYLILTIPVALFFMIDRLSLFTTDYLDFYGLIQGYELERLRYPFHLIYAGVLFLIVSLLCEVIFLWRGRRCIENEKPV